MTLGEANIKSMDIAKRKDEEKEAEEFGEKAELNAEKEALSLPSEAEVKPFSEAAEEAESKNGEEIKKLAEENSALKKEIEDLKKIIEESAALNRESMNALAKEDDNTDMDLSVLIYGTDEERRGGVDKLKRILLHSIKDDAKEIMAERDDARREVERSRAIRLLGTMDEFPGFSEKADIIDALIGRSGILKACNDPMEQLISAYIMQAGIEAIEKAKNGTKAEDIVKLYLDDENIRNAIELERLKNIKDEDIPPMPSGGNASGAEPFVPAPPKNMNEARSFIEKLYKKR